MCFNLIKFKFGFVLFDYLIWLTMRISNGNSWIMNDENEEGKRARYQLVIRLRSPNHLSANCHKNKVKVDQEKTIVDIKKC